MSATLMLLAVLGLLASSAQASSLRRSLQDPNCNQWNYNTNSCDKCSWMYYMHDGLCTRVSDDCNGYNEANGHCTGCYHGYTLDEVDGTCNPDEGAPASGDDLPEGCHLYDCEAQRCTECKEGYRLTEEGTCEMIPATGGNPDPNCKIWDCDEEICLECHEGYDVQDDGSCGIPPASTGDPDPSCHIWNGDVCEECSYRYVMIEGVCYRVSDSCKDWNDVG